MGTVNYTDIMEFPLSGLMTEVLKAQMFPGHFTHRTNELLLEVSYTKVRLEHTITKDIPLNFARFSELMALCPG